MQKVGDEVVTRFGSGVVVGFEAFNGKGEEVEPTLTPARNDSRIKVKLDNPPAGWPSDMACFFKSYNNPDQYDYF